MTYDPDMMERMGLLWFKGGGNSAGGGGGGSGKVSYPSMQMEIQEKWLNDNNGKSLDDAIDAMFGNSPYRDAYSYDPTDELVQAQDRFDTFAAALDDLLTGADWEIYLDLAKAQYEANVDEAGLLNEDLIAPSVPDDALIPDDVLAFSNSQRVIRQRRLAQFFGGMADIGAVNSSAFTIGAALMQSEFADEDAQYEARLRLEQSRQLMEARMQYNGQLIQYQGQKIQVSLGKIEFMNRAAAQLMSFQYQNVDAQRTAATLQAEMSRVRLVAMSEHVKRSVELGVFDSTWDLEIFQHGANMLSALAGGTATPGSLSDKGSGPSTMIGGAISGAVSGAMLGSAVPGIGTVVGAGIGGIAGALSS